MFAVPFGATLILIRTNMPEGTDNSIYWLSKGQGGIATTTVLMPFAEISFLGSSGWSPSNGPRPDVSHRQDGRPVGVVSARTRQDGEHALDVVAELLHVLAQELCL